MAQRLGMAMVFLLVAAVRTPAADAPDEVELVRQAADAPAPQAVLAPAPAEDPDPLTPVLMEFAAAPAEPAPESAKASDLPKPLQSPPPMRLTATDPLGLGPWMLLSAVLLGLAIVLRSRRNQGSPLPAGARVLSATPIDRRRQVAVVEIAGRVMVIGTSGREMTVLDTINDPEELERIRAENQADAESVTPTRPLPPRPQGSQRLAAAPAMTSGRGVRSSARHAAAGNSSRRASSAGPFEDVSAVSDTAPIATSSRRSSVALAEGVLRLHGKKK